LAQQWHLKNWACRSLTFAKIGVALLAACGTPTQPVPTSNEPAAVVETLPTATSTEMPTVAVALYDGITHGITG
jgi:hypothetical protein